MSVISISLIRLILQADLGLAYYIPISYCIGNCRTQEKKRYQEHHQTGNKNHDSVYIFNGVMPHVIFFFVGFRSVQFFLKLFQMCLPNLIPI